MQGIRDKVAIVSGGALSIGAEIVRAFVEQGARAIIADVNREAGESLAGELGDKVLYVPMDLAVDAEIEAGVKSALDTFGRIDFVVNAAAIYQDQGPDSGRADWTRSFEVNVIGPVMLARAARSALAASKGAIVNIGSISARVAQAGRWTYPASKAALAQATRSLALDLAGDGIRVNSVSPGWTWSSGMEQLGLKRPIVDKVAGAFHLMGRAADRREIAEAVLFLCSDHARFITGADLAVDGGYTAMGPEGRPSALAAVAAAMQEAEHDH